MKLERELMVCVWLMVLTSVFAGDNYYVSPIGSHSAPFDSMSAAATNIQTAIDLASDGDAVILDDGHYILSAEIRVTRDILLVSTNGSSSTIIDGNGVVRCLNLSNVACIISGLTITNGWVVGSSGGGIYCSGGFPVVTNCIVVGNEAQYGGGMFDGVAYDSSFIDNIAIDDGGGVSEAVVFNSTISGNTAGGYGGGIIYGEAYNCRIKGNHSDDESGGMDSSIADNCLIEGNSAVGNGGGAAWGSVVGCTIVGNTSLASGGGLNYSESYNSIVYSNTALVSGNNIYDPREMLYCCSPDAINGNGNITNAPFFLNMGEGNLYLQASSPCKNTGDNIYVSTTTDLDGNIRIFDDTVDVGAFESGDFDGDGMDDPWEIYYFGSTNALPNAHGDIDLFSNLEEYTIGTDPTDPDSFPVFAVTTDLMTGSPVIEWWPSVMAREYVVLWAESMTNTFGQLNSIPIEYPQNSYTDTVHSADSSGFYRVNVQLK